jgi:hypothetical protein
LHVPWGASSFHLKCHFVVIIVFDFTWYHFVLNKEGVMILCLCTLYFNSNRIFCAQTLGSFLILFKAFFCGLIIISLFNLFFGSFDCSLHSLEVSSPCYLILFAIFDPQYWLISFEFSNLHMCICFHLYFWFMHTLWRNSHYIGLLSY